MLISIDERDSRPIYVQIARQIKAQIQSGELHPGDELPSVRELADGLGINLHTVRRAYQELSGAGLLSVRMGRRARVLMFVPPGGVPARVRTKFADRVRELLVDGLLTGFSRQGLHDLIENELDKLTAGPDRVDVKE